MSSGALAGDDRQARRPRPAGPGPRAGAGRPAAACRARRAAPSCCSRSLSWRAILAAVVVLPEPCRPAIRMTAAAGRRGGGRVSSRAQDRHELVVDDLHDHLAGRDAAQHLLADGALAHPADEVLDHRQRHVGLEQGDADLPHRLADVGLAQRRLGRAGGRRRHRAGWTGCRTCQKCRKGRARPPPGRGPVRLQVVSRGDRQAGREPSACAPPRTPKSRRGLSHRPWAASGGRQAHSPGGPAAGGRGSRLRRATGSRRRCPWSRSSAAR